MQSKYLNTAKDLHKALQWLSVNNYVVVAYGCKDEVIIKIEPKEGAVTELYGCKVITNNTGE